MNYRLLLTEMLQDYIERREKTKSLKVYKTYNEIIGDLVISLNIEAVQLEVKESLEGTDTIEMIKLKLYKDIEEAQNQKRLAVDAEDYKLASKYLKIIEDLNKKSDEL
tara:strand:+ start:481 stop:804 length:324 start_codon:yes stop_codon:yes gene_type:complete